jgi:hypothetical protein
MLAKITYWWPAVTGIPPALKVSKWNRESLNETNRAADW